MPRFGWGASAALVEPAASIAESGFTSGYRPPAQWINYLFHYSLAWVDHLRGPGWGAWTREDHGGTAVAFTAVAGVAVDTDDSRASAQRYRWAIVGTESGPAPTLCTSRNGRTWQDRAVPTGFAGTLRGIAYGADLWVLWGTGTSECWTTPADTGSNNSAVRTGTAGHWSALSAASGYRVGGVAWNGGTEIYLVDRLNSTNTDLIRTTNSGSSWSVATVTWPSSSHTGADIVYDDSRARYVVSSSIGGILTWTPATASSSGLLATLSGIGTDADVRLRVGGPETERTLIAWASYRHDGTTALAATQLWRSTNGGASWSAITLPTAMSASGGAAIVTDVQHVDGTWIATTSAAPYLWRSDDDGQNWERVALPITDTLADWPLYRAIYADGIVLCTGLDWTLTSARASAESPGTWTSREPAYLANAGYLRGRRIAVTAPTAGQVLAWDTGTSTWVPTSPTSLTGMPWTSTVAPTTVQTTNATQTTLATIPTTTNKGHALDLTILAVQSDRSEAVAFKVLASVTNAGGTVTVRDVVPTPSDGGGSGWSVTVDASGTNVRVRVTGAGGTTIDWSVCGTVLVHGS